MKRHIDTLRWSAWLGWQIDSNWASPWVFILYVLVKPLAGSLLLVCMYLAAQSATKGQVPTSFLPFLYVSSASFMVVAGVTFGMSNAVVTDRESYRMLKLIRVSPAALPGYLIGRGASRSGQAAVGAVLTVGLGLLLFPELRAALTREPIAWGWLLIYLVIGAVMMAALGLILSGIVLNMARYGMFLSEGVAGMLYMLSGAVFPIQILPVWLRCLSLALPPTYWLEGMRRALLGPSTVASPPSSWGHEQLALALLASTLVLVVSAWFFFRWCERRAWRLGRFEQTTGM